MPAQTDRTGASELGRRPAESGPSRLENMSLEEVKSFLMGKPRARHEGNVSRAADALGLSRSALYRRLQKYGL